MTKTIVAELASAVQNAVQDVHDRYENRDMIGGPIGSIYDPPATRYEYYLYVNDRIYDVIIEEHRSDAQTTGKEFSNED